MPEDKPNLAEVLRFQQSLMKLVTQGTPVAPESKRPAADQAEQLEVWVRQVRSKSS